jgi:hypothetical protein
LGRQVGVGRHFHVAVAHVDRSDHGAFGGCVDVHVGGLLGRRRLVFEVALGRKWFGHVGVLLFLGSDGLQPGDERRAPLVLALVVERRLGTP